jgi:hypothetical protein
MCLIDKKDLQRIIDGLPKALRSLLEAELLIGNEIVEVGHSFPAPPIGGYIKLAKPISTNLDTTKAELIFSERYNSLYSGEYTDSNRRFFILTPPKPSIKIGLGTKRLRHKKSGFEKVTLKTDSIKSNLVSPLQRFEKSMDIDYEKWHDGIGYDIDAIRVASPSERKAIEKMLIQHNPRDWRDIEALAQINTKNAQFTIKNAMKDPNPDVRIAVTKYAPNLVTDSERTQSIINALQHAEIFSGLSRTLDDIEEYHPPEVKEALLNGLLSREGDVAVLFAAMLFYLYGKAKEPFDMKQRPFFLRFNTKNKEERVKAFIELCNQLNINSKEYLTPK